MAPRTKKKYERKEKKITRQIAARTLTLALSIARPLALSSLASYASPPDDDEAGGEAPPLGIDRAKEGGEGRRYPRVHDDDDDDDDDDDLDNDRHEDEDDAVDAPRAMAADVRERMDAFLIAFWVTVSVPSIGEEWASDKRRRAVLSRLGRCAAWKSYLKGYSLST